MGINTSCSCNQQEFWKDNEYKEKKRKEKKRGELHVTDLIWEFLFQWKSILDESSEEFNRAKWSSWPKVDGKLRKKKKNIIVLDANCSWWKERLISNAVLLIQFVLFFPYIFQKIFKIDHLRCNCLLKLGKLGLAS